MFQSFRQTRQRHMGLEEGPLSPPHERRERANRQKISEVASKVGSYVFAFWKISFSRSIFSDAQILFL